jgi:hypothetical protein
MLMSKLGHSPKLVHLEVLPDQVAYVRFLLDFTAGGACYAHVQTWTFAQTGPSEGAPEHDGLRQNFALYKSPSRASSERYHSMIIP